MMSKVNFGFCLFVNKILVLDFPRQRMIVAEPSIEYRYLNSFVLVIYLTPFDSLNDGGQIPKFVKPGFRGNFAVTAEFVNYLRRRQLYS